MLVISRRESEKIVIGNIVIEVVKSRRGCARLAISAPDDVRILRSELVDEVLPRPNQLTEEAS